MYDLYMSHFLNNKTKIFLIFTHDEQDLILVYTPDNHPTLPRFVHVHREQGVRIIPVEEQAAVFISTYRVYELSCLSEDFVAFKEFIGSAEGNPPSPYTKLPKWCHCLFHCLPMKEGTWTPGKFASVALGNAGLVNVVTHIDPKATSPSDLVKYLKLQHNMRESIL